MTNMAFADPTIMNYRGRDPWMDNVGDKRTIKENGGGVRWACKSGEL